MDLKPIGFVKNIDSSVTFVYKYSEIIEYLSKHFTDSDELNEFFKVNWESNKDILILHEIDVN